MHRSTTLAPRAARGRHDHGALQARSAPAADKRHAMRDQPRPGRVAPSQALPVARPARVTANPGSPLGCTPIALRGHRAEEAAFFLVRSIRALQVLRLTGSGERGFTGAETESNRSTVCLLLYFAAVLGLNPRIIFSNCTSDLWSYGDSNSGPLACHQQAAHPPKSITAGHRPAACTSVRQSPGRLRYFLAVLPRRSARVQERCGTPATPSADRLQPKVISRDDLTPLHDTRTVAEETHISTIRYTGKCGFREADGWCAAAAGAPGRWHVAGGAGCAGGRDAERDQRL